MARAWLVRLCVVLLSVLISFAKAKRDAVLYCSACRAIVEEMSYSVSLVDPKKTINVGGFRLSPDGTMRDRKVPLARSEMHLSELLDGLCERMNDYALYQDPDSGEKLYRRFAPRGDQDMRDLPDFKNFKFEGPEGNALKFACETVREELEDDIISVFQQDSQNAQQQLCSNMSGYCKGHVNEEL